MSRHRLIVLKFGGSVLRDESTLRLALHEIYRWRRQGWRVAAVVSAFAGRTDELLRAADRTSAGAEAHATAALVATGELHSAGLLGLHLDRAGIRAAVLWPMCFDLVAEGPPLDANPVSLCRTTLERALARYGVVVIPGYTAQDAEGRPVVLGRGGSDLTALFIAQALEAEKCRLIKDVDGLYDRDPSLVVPLAACPPVRALTDPDTGGQAASGTAGEVEVDGRDTPGDGPLRYNTATYADALATDGTIVQHKAIRFAQRNGLVFELGRLNGAPPSRIGDGRTSYGPADRPRRRRVALLGLGTVGGGVLELLRQLGEDFEVTMAAVRDPSRLRPGLTDLPPLTDDPIAAAESGVDLVIEAMGGRHPARAAVEAALLMGADVVTANKSLMARHGRALQRLARSSGRRIACSAAVGGSMPLLERVSALPPGSVRQVRAVINGTTNFILDRVADGLGFAAALRLAQAYGYAEADPSHDLEGIDAAEKLCLVARAIGNELSPEDVDRQALTAEAIAAAQAPCRDPERCPSRYGGPLRHVASLTVGPAGVVGEVRLLQVGPEDPLAKARDAGNAAVIELSDGRCDVIQGKGAGRWPTAEAVLADVLEMARRHDRDADESPCQAEAAGARRAVALSAG